MDYMYLKNKIGSIDKGPFMQALKLAIQHVHSLGLAHNDINPANIIVKDGMPVLIDFGSARRIGSSWEPVGASRGGLMERWRITTHQKRNMTF
jgi:serine/threonine protein kinase